MSALPPGGAEQSIRTAVKAADGRRRARLFWLLQFAGWSSLTFISLITLHAGHFDVESPSSLAIFRGILGLALTTLLRWPYRWLRKRITNYWALGIGIFLFTGLLGVVDSLIVLVAGPMTGIDVANTGSRSVIIGTIPVRWLVYWAWSTLYFGINYWLDTQDFKLRLAQAEAASRESELLMLRSQINPHFLFNALNSIQATAGDTEAVCNLTQALAEYLRFSLEQRGDIQPLGRELDALEGYLKVEKTRFEERLEYTMEADCDARQALAPVAVVQPILENAIKYGQHSGSWPLKVGIRAWIEGETLHIRVENTGSWVAPSRSATSTGIGMANVRRRLELLYGSRASIRTETSEEKVCVAIDIPLQEALWEPFDETKVAHASS